MLKFLAAVGLGFLLSACMATNPERMSEIEPYKQEMHAGMSCRALHDGLSGLEVQMNDWYRVLNQRYQMDRAQFATGFVLPPVFFAVEATDGPEALNYRVALGKQSDLFEQWQEDNCPGPRLNLAEQYEAAVANAGNSQTDDDTADLYQAALKAAQQN